MVTTTAREETVGPVTRTGGILTQSLKGAGPLDVNRAGHPADLG